MCQHTLISWREASDKYVLTDGDSRSEYLGDAGRSASELRELEPTSKLSPALLCCREHSRDLVLDKLL
jgi:hypothetical protein